MNLVFSLYFCIKFSSIWLGTMANEPPRRHSHAMADHPHGGAPALDHISHEQHIMCNFPAFCSENALDICNDTLLRNCAECSNGGATILLTCVIFVAFLTLLGNGLVLWSVVKETEDEMSKYNIVKASLATTDFLQGVFVCGVVIPNIIWTVNHTAWELDTQDFHNKNTRKTTIGVIVFLFFFVSNMYQLTLLCCLRLHAIARPWQSSRFERKHVITLLICAWILALAAAMMPLMFPSVFVLTYQQNIFIYFLGINRDQKSQSTFVVLLMTFHMIPYAIMTLTTIATLVIVRNSLKKSSDLSFGSNHIPKIEKKITRNIALMECGFTITTLPFVTNVVLVIFDFIECSDISKPYLATFCIFYLRNIVNVTIYVIMDQKFRTFVYTSVFGAKAAPEDYRGRLRRRVSKYRSNSSRRSERGVGGGEDRRSSEATLKPSNPRRLSSKEDEC